MKNLFLILIFICNQAEYLFCQNYVTFSTTNSDCQLNNGVIHFSLDPSLLLDYDLPFPLEISQLPNLKDTYSLITSLNHTVSNLKPGSYNARIWLNETNGCKIDIPFTIDEEDTPMSGAIVYQCNTGCIDLNISEGTSPYEVTWLRKQGAEFIILPGWPKSNITGLANDEDLCTNIIAGIYKVIVSDALCGHIELNIKIDPCDCIKIKLADINNVSYCESLDVFPPAPPYQACDGRLTIEVEGASNVTANWSNGASGLSVKDLCTGIYTVTVSNGICNVVRSYEVCCCQFNSNTNDPGDIFLCTDNGFPSDIGITNTIEHATTATSFDGSILISTNGGGSNKVFKWSGPNGFTSYDQSITNIGPGTYTLIVTDGCTRKELTFKVFSCGNISTILSSKIYDACEGMSNGEIHLSVPPGIGVFWEVNPPVNGHIIRNLPPGSYCANLTDLLTGCSKNMCFTIGVTAPIELEVSNIQTSCQSHNSGSAIVSFNNGNQPGYFYQLFRNSIMVSSGGVNNQILSDINVQNNNLASGEYTFTAANRCGFNVANFTIINSALDVEVVTQIGCDDNSSITLIPTGDNPPFTYRWNNSLPPLASHSNLKRSQYSVTVSDSKGCQKIIEINDLKPAIEIVEKISACTGMWDGSITLSLNNPNHEEIQPYYSFGPCPDCPVFPISIDNNTSNPVVFTMRDLSGTEQYTIGVNIGTCFYNFKFKVGEDQGSREFNKFKDLGNDKIMCIYDEKCKDNIRPESISAPARLQAEQGKCEGLAAGLYGVFSDCGTQDFFCDSVKVRSKEVGTRFLRVGQWIEWMTLTGKADFIPWHILGDYCHYISVCENMPECLNGGGRWSLTGGHKVDEIKLSNGCIKVICKSDFFSQPAPDYVICGLDFLPEYIPFTYQPDLPGRKCNTTTKNMAEMVFFLDELVQKYGNDFKNSSLYKTLKFYEGDLRLNCAQITFCICAEGSDCIDKYRFESTDIEDIICYPMVPPINSGNGLIGETCTAYFEENEDFSYVWCTKGCTDGAIRPSCTKLVKLNYDFSKFKFTRFNDDPSTVVFRSNEVSRFERFSFSKLTPDVIYTDGIFSTKNKDNFYHNAYNEEWNINTSYKAEFVYQDFTTNEGIFIKRDLQNGYNVFSTFNLYSPLNINFNTIYNVKNQPVNQIDNKGKFILTNLNPYQNSYLITGKTDTSVFQLLLDKNNHISKIQSISGFIDSSHVVTGKGFSSFVTRIPGNRIYFNNTEVITKYLSKTSLIRFKDTYDGSIKVSETISWLRPNTLIKVEENFETGSEIYLFKGFGGIDFKGTSIPESGIEMIYIIHEVKGNIFWKLYPVSDVLDSKYISLSSDKEGNIYLGMNFNGNLKTSEIDIHSKGKLDIVILKYKYDGTFSGFKSFGSEENEILKDMYCGEYAVHLGGDIEGNIMHRKIGDLTFAKLDTLASHAFISFTGTSDFEKLENRLSNTSLVKPELIEFTLIPNPTTSFVELKINQIINTPLMVVIENMDGKILFSTYLLKNQFSNDTFVLNTNDLPSGAYIVKLSSSDRIIGTKKLIKI